MNLTFEFTCLPLKHILEVENGKVIRGEQKSLCIQSTHILVRISTLKARDKRLI